MSSPESVYDLPIDKIRYLYNVLFKEHGHQGWWPVSLNSDNSKAEYHPGDYDIPKNSFQLFEVCTGAILTQNTSWKQASKAILNLKKERVMDPGILISLTPERLSSLIKPSGFFNRKEKILRIFAEFFLGNGKAIPKREDLLSLFGIGKETADSILLYGYKSPVFVIDSYTKRILSRIFNLSLSAEYDLWREKFHDAFRREPGRVKTSLFNEYHALFVRHAKNSCRKNPVCESCILKEICYHRNYG